MLILGVRTKLILILAIPFLTHAPWIEQTTSSYGPHPASCFTWADLCAHTELYEIRRSINSLGSTYSIVGPMQCNLRADAQIWIFKFFLRWHLLTEFTPIQSCMLICSVAERWCYVKSWAKFVEFKAKSGLGHEVQSSSQIRQQHDCLTASSISAQFFKCF